MFVFISYKSEDANLVRQTAEELTAVGLDLWFNEYRILAAEYEQFEDAIDDGVRRATHAVVFTNNRWARSKWCGIEMEGLLERIPDRSRIVEVAIPWEDGPREAFPDLLGRPAVLFQGDPRRPSHDDVHRLVVEILGRLGYGTSQTALPAIESKPVWLPSYGVTFDPGPFRLWPERTRRQLVARRLQSDTVLGLRTAVFHLGGDKIDVSMDAYATNYESPISRLEISDAGASDDRAVYAAYRGYAKNWFPTEHGHFRHVDFQPKGLHLVFVEGTSQIGVSYVSKMEGEARDEARWERRYAVRIPNPLRPDARGELAFVFSVGLPGDEAQQLRAFCRLAPWFDAVVESARVRWPSRARSLAMALPAVLAKGALAAAAGFLGWRVLEQGWNPWPLAGAAALIGLTAGDLASYLFSRTYRALLASLRPAINDLRPAASPVRFLSDLWFHLITLPTVLAGLLGRGLVVALLYVPRIMALPLILGWAAMFSKKAFVTPPAWLRAHPLAVVVAAAAAVFGFAASQFTRGLVKARFLKVPK